MVAKQSSHDHMLERLGVLANQALSLWSIPEDAQARLINVSENATYVVENAAGYKSVLRIHRQDYHTRNAITCELAWMRALSRDGGVITPGIITGRDGEDVQQGQVSGLPGSRFMVMFEFVEGVEPNEDEDLVAPFEELGEIAAKTHIHSMAWTRPANFERLVWNLEAVYGADATWKNWRDAPRMDSPSLEVLTRLEEVVKRRLSGFGNDPDKYGLIHADMRLANLLIDRGTTRLIDFDDCGLGWFLYDFAAGISFMEDHPQVPALKAAWTAGYRRVRPLSESEETEIDTFVMLRRMALCAWIGSHMETETAQALAPNFTRVSAELAENYLSRFG